MKHLALLTVLALAAWLGSRALAASSHSTSPVRSAGQAQSVVDDARHKLGVAATARPTDLPQP